VTAGPGMRESRSVHLDLDSIARYASGCAILGTGGGGDVRVPLMIAQSAIAECGPVAVVRPEDLPDEALVLPVGAWGAPTVSIEKFDSGDEGRLLCEAAERWFQRPVAALMPGEIGGGNGVQLVAWCARMGLPLVDADGMGRAFPEGDMCAMHVAGVSPAPAFFADERGNVVTALPVDAIWHERIARQLVLASGGVIAGADHPMDAATVRTAAIQGSVSYALAIGDALARSGVDGILAVTGGRRLVTGKVVDVERVTAGGFARGVVAIEGTGSDADRAVRLQVQNENLIAEEAGRTLACTPDLITVVDAEAGEPIPTERIRYGQRVTVIGMPCAEIWRTPRGLEVAGPERFGYPGPWVPIGDAAP
jgi:uncharacterized protein